MRTPVQKHHIYIYGRHYVCFVYWYARLYDSVLHRFARFYMGRLYRYARSSTFLSQRPRDRLRPGAQARPRAEAAPAVQEEAPVLLLASRGDARHLHGELRARDR